MFLWKIFYTCDTCAFRRFGLKHHSFTGAGAALSSQWNDTNFEASMSSHSPPQKTGDLKLRYCVVASVLNFRLNLFYNEITELPESLGQLQKLRKLHLGAPASETFVGFTALEVRLWWKKLKGKSGTFWCKIFGTSIFFSHALPTAVLFCLSAMLSLMSTSLRRLQSLGKASRKHRRTFPPTGEIYCCTAVLWKFFQLDIRVSVSCFSWLPR